MPLFHVAGASWTLTGCGLVQLYGMTEIAGGIVALPRNAAGKILRR